MPVTFFAHQAPVLPIARRWPSAVDGVALVIGSMAPDMAYVLNGSRFRIWAHAFPGVVTFCVPATLAVSWVVVRLLAPVVPSFLPQRGPWFLGDYRGLAIHRFRLLASPLSALAGALSHVGLDHFTHDWGWFARHVSWYDAVLIDGWMGRDWTVFRIAQLVGHIGGTALCLWLLARYGRQRWMADRAAQVVTFPKSVRASAIFYTASSLGAIAGVAWVASGSNGSATDTIRIAATTFAGMCVGVVAIRRVDVAVSVTT